MCLTPSGGLENAVSKKVTELRSCLPDKSMETSSPSTGAPQCLQGLLQAAVMPVDLNGFVPHGLIPPGTARLVMKIEEQEGKHNCVCARKDCQWEGNNREGGN